MAGGGVGSGVAGGRTGGSSSQQAAHPDQVQRGQGEVGQLLDLPASRHARPPEPAELLEPAEDLLVELPLALADREGVARLAPLVEPAGPRAAVLRVGAAQRRPARARHVRPDAAVGGVDRRRVACRIGEEGSIASP